MKKNNSGIPIEILNKILDEFDYENFLFSKKTTKLEYYIKKVLRYVHEFINYVIKFFIYYTIAYLIYKIVGPNINWVVILLASILINK